VVDEDSERNACLLNCERERYRGREKRIVLATGNQKSEGGSLGPGLPGGERRPWGREIGAKMQRQTAPSVGEKEASGKKTKDE